MRTLMTGPASVHYGQIYVESAENYADLGECFAGQGNGLCGAAVEGKLFLITGLHTGEVSRWSIGICCSSGRRGRRLIG